MDNGIVTDVRRLTILPTLVAIALTASLAPGAAQSQDVTGSLTLYGWLPWIDTEATARASGRTARTSADPGDILEALEIGVMAAGELRYGRLGLLQDLQYSKLGGGGTLTGPFAVAIDADVSMLIATTAISYRVFEEGGRFVEPFAGFRYIDFETDVTATGGGPLGAARSVSVNEDWFDPIVGVRARTPLTESLSLGGFALIGGFGAGSEFTWEVFAGLDYAITPSVSATAGFRYLYFDREADRADVTLEQYGPVIGLRIGF